MAKKGNRVQVILECTEQKRERRCGNVPLHHHQEQEKHPRPSERKKYNPFLKRATVHREIK